MFRREQLAMKKKEFRMSYDDPLAITQIKSTMLDVLPTIPTNYVVVCIGTDRSTGDSLGPLVGSMLIEKRLRHLSVYGTLHKPVHALNLEETLEQIKQTHHQPFIISIDACLGKKKNVGEIVFGVGPLKPGSALQKNLPEIGDIHLTGIVNVAGFMEFNVLQSTRLSIVVDLAEAISEVIASLDDELTTPRIMPARLKRNPIYRQTMSN